MTLLETIVAVFLLCILASVLVYYITDVLLLVDGDRDKGPFESLTKKFIWVKVFKDNDVTHRDREERKVNAWDYIRRVFGLYEILENDGEELWYVRPQRAHVWECPHCLGFWVSIFPGWIVASIVVNGILQAVVISVPLIFIIAGFNSILVSIVDALYNKNNLPLIFDMDEEDYD